mgnify:FL=1
MKNLLSKTILCFILSICIQRASAANWWRQLGDKYGSYTVGGSTYYAPALCYNAAADEIYTAYIDGATKELLVLKLIKIPARKGFIYQWQRVGRTNVQTAATEPSLAINPVTNQVYVGYVDGGPNEYVVQYFDGTNWNKVGQINNVIPKRDCLPAIAFKPQTSELYIAFIDENNKNEVIVNMYDGKNWKTAGSNSIGNASAVVPIGWTSKNIEHSCSIGFQPNTKTLYVAYINDTGYLDVKYLDNNLTWNTTYASFSLVGNNKAVSISNKALAFHPLTNQPYVAFVGKLSMMPSTYFIKVVRYSSKVYNLGLPGANKKAYWAEMKSDSLCGNSGLPPALIFNTQKNQPVVSQFHSGSGRYVVSQFTGSYWRSIGFRYGTDNPYDASCPDCNQKYDIHIVQSPGYAYNLDAVVPTLLFNPSNNKIHIAYPNSMVGQFELNSEP